MKLKEKCNCSEVLQDQGKMNLEVQDKENL